MEQGGQFQGFGLFAFPGPPLDRWCFGWLTGPDGDLICVKPNMTDNYQADLLLSPICTSPARAFFAFLLKRLLARFDMNLTMWMLPR